MASDRALWRYGTATAACLELAFLYGPTLVWLWSRWTLSVWQNVHGLLIAPYALYLMFVTLRRRRHLPATPTPWGFAIVVPALALLALDAGMHTELGSAVSLVLLVPGLSLLLLGAESTRAILFPTAFLAFALPIPLAFTEPIHWQLRQLVTSAAAAVLPELGVPVLREVTTLRLPNGTIHIADACSGFSTLYAALAFACLTASTTASRVRRWMVLVVAAPIAIASNLVRVILLVFLAGWTGDAILGTFLHPLSGVLTFAATIPIILWVGGSPRREAAG